ncbi:hypothetical protein R3I94_013963 [Phoxinus phoxinus]
MDDKCHIDMLGLMILCSLLTGTSGEITYLHVFSSDGESVSLPCENLHSDCTSTTWMYNGESSSGTVVLFEEGMKRKDTERRERLSLGSDCSLNIYKATTEDRGHYVCRKLNAQIYDDNVYLHVLHVSPSSTHTEITPGRSFSLSCQLYDHDGYSCVRLFNEEGFELVWKNKTDVNLQSDSRYQISFSPEQCNSSLTTTLLDEDNNTQWRCEITKGEDVQTSVRYTVTYLATEDTAQVIPAVAALLALLAVLALIALWFICKKRAGADKAAIGRLTPVTRPAADVHENTDDVAYAEVTISRNKFTETHNVQSDDKVTYAAIRGANAGDLKFC